MSAPEKHLGADQNNRAMKISVCLATYNGAEYLQHQIQSILDQIRLSDELIVVDDCSQDASGQIVKSFADQRVRLIRNETNLGVFSTFERALRASSGDILFLSDQDDIWLPEKVEKVVSAFATRPSVTMVISDAEVIDALGGIIARSFFGQRGAFSPGLVHNFVKNKYLGCTMAFRRAMLAHFLPIPSDVPMHDMWFGLLNAIYGRTLYIDQPLIQYRRHASNASPSTGASPMVRFIWRWQLAKNLIARIFRGRIDYT